LPNFAAADLALHFLHNRTLGWPAERGGVDGVA
jgi:hypothetical protein